MSKKLLSTAEIHKDINLVGEHMYSRWLWRFFALPGSVWLVLLFVVPLYVILCVAFGSINPILNTPVPLWNPFHWSFIAATETIIGFIPGRTYWIVFVRTFWYVACAVSISLLIGYPVSYYVARLAKRTKILLLVLLVMPFWVSYLMRMLAWVGLLEPNGLINQFLVFTHITKHPPNWLGGHAGTVIFGLIYGYLPYMILALVSALDRLDQSVIEASHDLGMNNFQTIYKVILPMSKMGILSGCAIVTLPMFGDYFTTHMMSGATSTSMIGSQIYLYFHGGPQPNVGAFLTIILTILLALIMMYYLRSIAREQSGAGLI